MKVASKKLARPIIKAAMRTKAKAAKKASRVRADNTLRPANLTKHRARMAKTIAMRG